MPDLSVRLKLAAVWTALMSLFVYADLLSFFRPGELADISAGNIGPVDVSQGSLLIAAIVVTIPALMIVVSAAAPFPLARWLGLGGGILYMLVSVSNLIGESSAYFASSRRPRDRARRSGGDHVHPTGGAPACRRRRAGSHAGASWHAYCTDVWLSGWRWSEAM